jgi:alpha,alpha-trehalase
MRRAVATCTSPEVFFGAAANNSSASQTVYTATDPLGLAMEALNLS